MDTDSSSAADLSPAPSANHSGSPFTPFTCSVCSRTYTSKGGLSKHLKLHHRDAWEAENQKENGNICCHLCSYRFPTLKLLICHMSGTHNVQMKISNLKFPSIHSFLAWKQAKEQETYSQYVQPCSPQTSASTKRWYYYCNRSGNYVPRGDGIRQLKIQGTQKIGHNCTAHMKVTQALVGDKELHVEFCSYHTHPIKLGHLKLPEPTRLMIASKLNEKVAIEKILDDVRSQTDIATSLNRQHLITRQDVHNIRRQFNIDAIQRHKDDQLSVCALVKELESLDYNPIVAFKPQGSEGTNGLKIEDFVLVVQTKFQCEMMKAFGCNLICMDATHGTNHYDFKLVSVLILDDFGEGVPVGWMVSNKEDGVVLTEFLRALQGRTGPITTKFFMSDDAEQYFSSWNKTYGGNPKKLLCCWHVDKAWRQNIQAHICNDYKKVEVYHHLRTLLQTLSVPDFRHNMQQCLSWMLSDPDLERFFQYFQTWYSQRVEQWAYCYRINTPVNTNMAVESFHRLLKIDYLDGKHNRRIDHLLTTLLRIAKDRVYDRALKNEKGKSTHRITEINRRHRTALDIQDKGIKATTSEDLVWKVPSATMDTVVYSVRRVQQDCYCKIRCGFCNACAHLYTCTCIDSAVHSTVCKHVHLVHMTESSESGTLSQCSQSLPSHSTDRNFQSSFDDTTFVNCGQTIQPQVQLSLPHSSISKLKQDMTMLVSEVQSITEDTSDVAILKAGIPHVTNAIAVMKAMMDNCSSQQLVKRKRVAPNENNTVQPRFHSTKKKRKTSKTLTSLSKPTATEVEDVTTLLSNVDTRVCSICFKEEDETSVEEQDISWIQCSKCSSWLHCRCSDQELLARATNDYICKYCKN